MARSLINKYSQQLGCLSLQCLVRTDYWTIKTLRPGQNGWHFADSNFKCIFFNDVLISNKILMKCVPGRPMGRVIHTSNSGGRKCKHIHMYLITRAGHKNSTEQGKMADITIFQSTNCIQIVLYTEILSNMPYLTIPLYMFYHFCLISLVKISDFWYFPWL